jgi:hypothetical protein
MAKPTSLFCAGSEMKPQLASGECNDVLPEQGRCTHHRAVTDKYEEMHEG